MLPLNTQQFVTAAEIFSNYVTGVKLVLSRMNETINKMNGTFTQEGLTDLTRVEFHISELEGYHEVNQRHFTELVVSLKQDFTKWKTDLLLSLTPNIENIKDTSVIECPELIIKSSPNDLEVCAETQSDDELPETQFVPTCIEPENDPLEVDVESSSNNEVEVPNSQKSITNNELNEEINGDENSQDSIINPSPEGLLTPSKFSVRSNELVVSNATDLNIPETNLNEQDCIENEANIEIQESPAKDDLEEQQNISDSLNRSTQLNDSNATDLNIPETNLDTQDCIENEPNIEIQESPTTDDLEEQENITSTAKDSLNQFLNALELNPVGMGNKTNEQRRISPTKIVSPKDKLKQINIRELDCDNLNSDIINTIEESFFVDSPEDILKKQVSDPESVNDEQSDTDSIKRMEEEILNGKLDDDEALSDDLIPDIDVSDEEVKQRCRKAAKNILYGSTSSESRSSSDEGDMDLLDSSFDAERRITRLNTEDELSKTPIKSQTETTPTKAKELIKSCKVQLERLFVDTDKSKEKTDSEDAEFRKLCNLTPLKRRRILTSPESDNSIHSSKQQRKRYKTRLSLKNRASPEKSSSSDSDESVKSDSSKSSTSSKSSKSTVRVPSQWSSENSDSDNVSEAESKENDDSSSSYSSSNSKSTKRRKVTRRLNLSNVDPESEEIRDIDDKTNVNRTPKKGDWKNDPLLRITLNTPKKKDVPRERKKSIEEIEISSDDDDDFVIITADSADDKKKPSIQKLRQTKLNYSSLKNLSTDSDSSVSSVDGTPKSTPQKMKNIRKVKSFEKLAEATKKANQEEKERLLRLSQIQESFELDASQYEDAANVFVLEYDSTTKQPKIEVSKEIADQLKDYQKDGVRFMWQACFESVELASTTRGSGCVIAHCMGLGKTLQVITLIHTLFKYQSDIKVKKVLILAPPSTIENWHQEFKRWVGKIEPKLNVYTLLDCQDIQARVRKLKLWYRCGGVMIMNYTLFRRMVNTDEPKPSDPKPKIIKGNTKYLKLFKKILLKPGPDLLICDEGHTLKNSKSQISKIIGDVKTKRRIMLTGTPMQNNLKEYYCMINLVKPCLLGSAAEFANQFVNPITAGQTKDSSIGDITRMKKRSHVLHKKLSGVVQRIESSVLKSFLPSLIHYVIFIKLSDVQLNIYKTFLKSIIAGKDKPSMKLLRTYELAKRITTHPKCLTYENTKVKPKSKKDVNEDEDQDEDLALSQEEELVTTKAWDSLYTKEELSKVQAGSKVVMFFYLLNQCTALGDKVVAFSTSLNILNAIEDFCKDSPIEGVTNYAWRSNLDYVRVDGSTPKQKRYEIYEKFNDPSNKRLKLLITSTKVSGLGVNLTGANRVIIMDTPWNPADDMQCVYRIYRLGQPKQCYIYSLVGLGTMEERIYERSVTKQAVACRVVDEQQIDRHYTRKGNVIKEFYTFRNYDELEIPAINVPSDRILANALQKLPNIIWKYHEHDKLLQNQEDEELDDAEREAAWNEFLLEEKRQNETAAALAAMATAQANINMNLGLPASSGVAANEALITAVYTNQRFTVPLVGHSGVPGGGFPPPHRPRFPPPQLMNNNNPSSIGRTPTLTPLRIGARYNLTTVENPVNRVRPSRSDNDVVRIDNLSDDDIQLTKDLEDAIRLTATDSYEFGNIRLISNKDRPVNKKRKMDTNNQTNDPDDIVILED